MQLIAWHRKIRCMSQQLIVTLYHCVRTNGERVRECDCDAVPLRYESDRGERVQTTLKSSKTPLQNIIVETNGATLMAGWAGHSLSYDFHQKDHSVSGVLVKCTLSKTLQSVCKGLRTGS